MRKILVTVAAFAAFTIVAGSLISGRPSSAAYPGGTPPPPPIPPGAATK